MFLATTEEEDFNIYDGLKFDSEKKQNETWHCEKKIEEFFVGEKHEDNESCKFHIWKREASVSRVLNRGSVTSCKKKKKKKELQFRTVAR